MAKKTNRYVLILKRDQLRRIYDSLGCGVKVQRIKNEVERSLKSPFRGWKPIHYRKNALVNVVQRLVRRIAKLRKRNEMLAGNNKWLIERNKELTQRLEGDN